MRTLPGIAVLAAAVLVTGCTTPTAVGETVRITNTRDDVAACTFVKQIHQSSGWGGLAMQGVGANNAMVALRDEAGAAGANTVLMITERANFGGARMIGDAYRCERRP